MSPYDIWQNLEFVDVFSTKHKFINTVNNLFILYLLYNILNKKWIQNYLKYIALLNIFLLKGIIFHHLLTFTQFQNSPHDSYMIQYHLKCVVSKIFLNVFEQVKFIKLTKAAFIWSKYSKNAVKTVSLWDIAI